jgi:hypothetical protein
MGLEFLSMGWIVRSPEELKGPPDQSTFNLSDFDLLTIAPGTGLIQGTMSGNVNHMDCSTQGNAILMTAEEAQPTAKQLSWS